MRYPGSYGATLSKSQDAVFVIVYRIFVLKVVAGACFFDYIAAPITAEFLENPIPCICYTSIVFTSIPADKRSESALVNGFLRLIKWISSLCDG